MDTSLPCEWEMGNLYNSQAVAIKKVINCTVSTLLVVGHIPGKITSICSIFYCSLFDSIFGARDLLKELFDCDIVAHLVHLSHISVSQAHG